MSTRGEPLSDSEAILATVNLTKRFGGLLAVNNLSLAIRAGRIHSLIGPNGAGKSTLFNLISGVMTPTSGSVLFEGRSITGLPPHRIARLGIARSFQTPRVFGALTVRENVILAAERIGPNGSGCDEALKRVWLQDRAHLRADALSHGERKRLELAQAMSCQPKLLLLDEPTAGMNAGETRDVAELVRSLAEERTVVIIEHDIDFVRQLAEHVTVLDRGAILFEGTVEEAMQDQNVRDIYLGERA